MLLKWLEELIQHKDSTVGLAILQSYSSELIIQPINQQELYGTQSIFFISLKPYNFIETISSINIDSKVFENYI